MTERTTLAFARPWPGILPLDEAAAFLSSKPDALRQRFRRGRQPGYWQGRRVFILLTPAQWAIWSLTSPRSLTAERTPEPTLHHSPERTSEHPAAAPTTGQEGVLVLLAQLEAARQRAEELAGLVGYWQGRAQAAEEQLTSVRPPVLANEQQTLSAPVRSLWRRLLPWWPLQQKA